MHTYFSVVKQKQLSTFAFYCTIGALWLFVYLMAVIGVIVTKTLGNVPLYSRAGAWCWINQSVGSLPSIYGHNQRR